jgi:hypothetical protein
MRTNGKKQETETDDERDPSLIHEEVPHMMKLGRSPDLGFDTFTVAGPRENYTPLPFSPSMGTGFY